MQYAEKAREIVVSVVRGQAVRSSHLRAAAERIVREPEVARPAESTRWRQRLQPVQRVIRFSEAEVLAWVKSQRGGCSAS